MSARATTDRVAAAVRRLEERAPLASRMTPDRWRHTLSVARTAERLAAALGWDEAARERAVTAALLHDAAKDLPEEEQRALAGADRRDDPAPLVHAAAGARLAAAAFCVDDPEVAAAIAAHPTGSATPSALERLLVAADFLEPGRRHRGAEDRALLDAALRGEVALEELFRRVLARKIAALLERGRPLHPRSLEAWNAACSADAGSRA
jgi:predicted HD superfamily hydrolase involved in NAD metabolism